MDRVALAKSRLYSKFQKMEDAISLAEIIGDRWQLIDDALQEVFDNWRKIPENSTNSSANEYLRQLGIAVGYSPSDIESEQDMLPWIKGYTRAVLSWGNLDDLISAANIVLTDSSALMDINEVGPSSFGSYNGLRMTTIEAKTEANAAVDNINKIYKLMSLLGTMTEAVSKVVVGFNLTQGPYLTDPGLYGEYLPALWRGGKRVVTFSNSYGTFNVGEKTTDGAGNFGRVLLWANPVLTVQMFDKPVTEIHTASGGFGIIGSYVNDYDVPLFRLDQFRITGTDSGTLVGEQLTQPFSGASGLITHKQIVAGVTELILDDAGTGTWTVGYPASGSSSGLNSFSVEGHTAPSVHLDNSGAYSLFNSTKKV